MPNSSVYEYLHYASVWSLHQGRISCQDGVAGGEQYGLVIQLGSVLLLTHSQLRESIRVIIWEVSNDVRQSSIQTITKQFGNYLTERTMARQLGFWFTTLTHTSLSVSQVYYKRKSLGSSRLAVRAVIGLLFPFQGCERGWILFSSLNVKQHLKVLKWLPEYFPSTLF
jgi:hypothetical protein